jgi:hypothetical protein
MLKTSLFSSIPLTTLRESVRERVTYSGVFIFTEDGKLLCIRQDRGIDIPWWHRDPGESPLECLEREVMEEVWVPLSEVILTEIREWNTRYRGMQDPLMAYFRAKTVDEARVLELFKNRWESHTHEASAVVFLTP